VTSASPVITVVSPVYRAERIVDELVRQLVDVLERLGESFEIILVEDGSPDNSWQKIEENCAKDQRVKGIKLSRNFGQHYAITAGLDASRGDYTVVIDCDLQDNPAYIEPMYAKAREGYDVVYTTKEKREHSAFKNITATLFFRVFNYLAETKSHGASVGAFSLLSRKALDAFLSVRELHRHYLMVVGMLGFRSYYLPIEHRKRFEGKSSYNISRLLKHSIVGITSQSVRLLRMSVKVGFAMVTISVLWALWIVASYFVHGAAPGYTSLMAMILLSTGLILSSIGIAGIYIGNIFEQVKNRPLYFVDKRVNM
jgi:polyisoprenyl-phosphate glycosyltransferase